MKIIFNQLQLNNELFLTNHKSVRKIICNQP